MSGGLLSNPAYIVRPPTSPSGDVATAKPPASLSGDVATAKPPASLSGDAATAKPPASLSGDAATECMVGVPTNCAVGALVACGLLALLLLVLGVSRYAFLVIWCVGIPFAAALGGGLVAWLQLRRPPPAP